MSKSTIPFTEQYPYLKEEWDFTANEKDPEYYSYGSNYRAHWVCKENIEHKWSTKIIERTVRNTGCPICASQKFQTTLDWSH